MRQLTLISICVILFIQHADLYAQSPRLNTREAIGWYNYFGTVNISRKIGLHTEYQLRRDNLITDWQQSLLRVGVNYQLSPNVLLRAGYAWVETFPYGEFPINSMGKQFTEHRTFQMVQIMQKQRIFELSHRFMLEQRFIGSFSSPELVKEDDFNMLNRVRYMFRIQMPLGSKEITDRTPYLAMYDEIFIGFGKNVNANIFDQNRIGVLFGYRHNENIRIEAGYLNQTLQFGRMINDQPVFQYNNGWIMNLIFHLKALKKK